jgi:GNAT superfamily N-acetyltransferase
MPTFRESLVTDAPATLALTSYFRERAQGFPAGPFAYLRSFPRAEQFVAPHGVFLIVEADGDDVGCGGIRRLAADDEARARFEVKHLWLTPAERGKGYGSQLMTELEARARELGADELVLDTNASLDAAMSLYRSAGFEQIAAYNDNPNATHWYLKRF